MNDLYPKYISETVKQLQSIKKLYDYDLSEEQTKALDYAISSVKENENQNNIRLGTNNICHSIVVRDKKNDKIAEVTTDENGRSIYFEKKGYQVFFEKHYTLVNV